MIPLFYIPTHTIDTSKFKNLLHDQVVTDFENRFAEYVGAKYAVSFDSASSGIFLAFFSEYEEVSIPSLLPPVVANALIMSACQLTFEDNVDWVGGPYVLHEWADCKFVDSAQWVEREQYQKVCDSDKDLMLFSFYPTKPISGYEGGMIVSNHKEAIDALRNLANSGMEMSANSWDRKQTGIGFKMYMTSIQAEIANEGLTKLEEKKEILAGIRLLYNAEFGLNNISHHLYRIPVKDNRKFMEKAAAAGIQCGIHYNALHQNPIFEYEGPALPDSDRDAVTMVSIPFHEKLTNKEIETVIKFVHEYK